MDSNVVKFYPADAAKNPDNVFEQAMGQYDKVLILGYDKDGCFDPRASSNLSEETILWMMEHFKMKMMRGDYDDN